ncbi:MAG: hypothetical protein V3R94_05385 [Acidobacteriota bacterium]
MGKLIQKLLYELKGKGALVKGGELLFEIPYELQFLQEIVDDGGEEKITGLADFSGQILPNDQYQLAVLVGSEVTLRLEHARCLNVIIQSSSGNLIKRGEIYKCGEPNR